MTEPYRIVGELKRFDRTNNAFARSKVDSNSAAHGLEAKSREEIAATGRHGYSQHDFALQTGAWAIAKQSRRARNREAEAEQMYSAERVGTGSYQPEDWSSFTERLKQAARFYGAALVGVTRVNQQWLYACDGREALPEDMNTAVMMAIAMDYDLIATSPTVTASAAAGRGYSDMAFVAASIAQYLRDLGWEAIPAGNETAISIPLAIDAGLGELGRNGLLITERYGPRVRLCKVFTNAPLVEDKAVSFGVTEFCDVCKKCADTCPSQSISRDARTDRGLTPSNNPGVLKWYVQVDKCLAFWRVNGASCSNCIRSCPFNKRLGWTHDLVRWFIKARWRWLDRFMVLMDSLSGYGTQKDPAKVLKG